jgi:hypothetical protein
MPKSAANRNLNKHIKNYHKNEDNVKVMFFRMDKNEKVTHKIEMRYL